MKKIFSIFSICMASIAFNVSAQTYVYDDAGRLQKLLFANGKGVAYAYDIRDNLTQVRKISIPPAVTNFSISRNSDFEALLSWQHAGDVQLFLVQSKLKGTDDWVNGGSITDVNARSATLPLTFGVERVYRIIVYGNNGEESAPSIGVALPSREPLVVTIIEDENDRVLGRGRGDSLREVIEAAIDGETIRFAPDLTGQTIHLDRGELILTKNLEIDASALPERITIDAVRKSRIFSVWAEGSVTLKGLRMTGGRSDYGGGLLNTGASLTLQDCEVFGNASVLRGGGVCNLSGGILRVFSSTISGNSSNDSGGGIFNGPDSSLEIVFSTISQNSATIGGGLFTEGPPTLVDRSAFWGNASQIDGGAIYNSGADTLIENSTIAGNSSFQGFGGGISNLNGGSMTVRHATIADNTGTGILNASSATLIMDNSIVANNFNLLNSPMDIAGDYTAVGANIVRVQTGSLLGGPTALQVDPVLEPLGFYGGSSRSMPPLVGSPALDAGILTANTPSTDQANSFRPNGVAPELGSIESRLSSETNLEWLTTSAGPLNPVFRSSVTSYLATVPNEITTVAFRPAKLENGQTVEIRMNNGVFSEVESKAASSELPLNTGENSVEVRVTAQNGNAVKTYAITIIRGSPSLANTDLAALTTSAGPISPTFDPATHAYHSVVSENTTSTTITATSANPNATMAVRVNFGDNIAIVPGATSPPLPLDMGPNAVDIIVTAEDGGTTALYSLTVTREPPAVSNALLAALSISAGPLSPNFSRGVFAYDTTVSGTVNSTTISAITAQLPASIKTRLNGGAFSTIVSGVSSGQMDLSPGANLIEVQVSAQDTSTVQSYFIFVNRIVETVDWVSAGGNASSTQPSVSADCRFVAFASNASNLVPNDTNNYEDIFVYDRLENTMRRISISNDGQQGDRNSTEPAISADGLFVAFQSEARNLVPGDENGQNDPSSGRDIFVYDMTLMTIERVSLRDNGGESNQASGNPSISGDGRFVVFESNANNLVSNFQVGNTNAYIHDRMENTIIGIPVPFADIQTNRDSLNPSISADGSYVAFEFSVDKNDDNQDLNYRYTDIYLYGTGGGTIERITGTKIGTEADGSKSEASSISGDGRYIAFESNLEDIDFYDTNDAVDVFVYDRVTGTTRRVSANGSTGGQMFRDSTNPSVSGDGRYVAFESMASNLVDLDTNGSIDIFITDISTGEILLASVNDAGVQGDDSSYLPSLSHDGTCIAFQSAATNMVPEDFGSSADIFLKETKTIVPGTVANLVSLTTSLGPLAMAGNTYSAVVSANLESVQLRPITADPLAQIQASLNSGTLVSLTSGAVSKLALAPGENRVEINVTSADGSVTQMYTLAIERTVTNDEFLRNADLSALETNAGALTPAFVSNTLSYSTVVSNETTTARISPSPSVSGASVTVNGELVTSGSASQAFPLNVGSNIFITTVTARDGVTRKSYAVTITRAPEEVVPGEGLIALTDVEIINGSPVIIRITWESEQDAIYIIEKSTGLAAWEFFGGDIFSTGESTTIDIELEAPAPEEIFLRLRLK